MTLRHPVERWSFPGALDAPLAARIVRPPAEAYAHALFAHGFTSSKDLLSIRGMSRALADCGIAVMSFDFTGLGESRGDFAATNFSTNVREIVLAARSLAERTGSPPSLLIGLSLGGAAAIVAAAQIPEARAIVTIGAPDTTEHLRDTLVAETPRLIYEQDAEAVIAGRPFRIRRQLIDDLGAHSVAGAAAKLAIPLLVIHSKDDEIVEFACAERLYAAAPEPKRLVALQGMDHLLLGRRTFAEEVGATIGAWARECLAPREPDRLQPRT